MDTAQEFINFFLKEVNKILKNETFSLPVKKINNFYQKTKKSKKILIIGDYDVDGITSTAFLKRFLSYWTNAKISTYIPSRYDGYSVTPEFLALNHKDYDLIVFADNGTDKKLTEYINANLKEKVFIFDHHPNDEVKNYDFLINPAIEENIEGISTGILFHKIYHSTYSYLKKNGFSLPKDEFNHIFALSAIADMCDLNTVYNRLVILDGFEKIKKENNLLFNDLDKNDILTELSFKIIPLINAGGRLLDNESINNIEWEDFFFNGENFYNIKEFLLEINNIRKQLTKNFYNEALKQYKGEKIFVCFLDNCPHGINGNIAQKFAQNGINAIIFSENIQELGMLVGSARGKGELKNFAFEIMKKFKGKVGGHQEAFGLNLIKEEFEKFKEEINKNVSLFKEKKEEKITLYPNQMNIDEFLKINKMINKILKGLPFNKNSMPVVNVSYNSEEFFIYKDYGEYVVLRYKDESFLMQKKDAEQILKSNENYFRITATSSLDVISNTDNIFQKITIEKTQKEKIKRELKR